MLQCVACGVAVFRIEFATWRGVLQCVAVCCSVLQCVAVCCMWGLLECNLYVNLYHCVIKTVFLSFSVVVLRIAFAVLHSVLHSVKLCFFSVL